ncbi:MAG: glutamate-1-semialdehyde 2,1-aminomutase [Phycisphaera sp.]|nr:glutamate-1-semialdehyde 2,1-aminomutase [Phycisphaera sp.]
MSAKSSKSKSADETVAPSVAVVKDASVSGSSPGKDRYARSAEAFEKARRLLPGGVNSPVRAYKAVGRTPVFIREGKGCTVTDIDGNTYIDYVMSYGPLLLGHAPQAVAIALNKAIAKGTSFGMPTEAETRLAELVTQLVPSIEVVRFVNSGTEAAMSAIRLARAATGRPKIIKCTGCYHGHSDALLVQAGSGATTLGSPSSPGVPESITSHTVLVPYNDLQAVARAMENFRGQIACMAVEPIAGNMGCVPPKKGYLEGLRELCDKHGVLLLFDEVMTGFRVHPGCAQGLYNVKPDITCLGKIIGGGLPCAAYGGREDLMRLVAPDGAMYQAGTLSGNPLAMAAGIAMLEAISDPEAKVYETLEKHAATLAVGLKDAAARAGVAVQLARVGSMMTVFFGDHPIENYEQATQCDTQKFATFFRGMLDHGVVLPPSQFEAWFVSNVHDAQAIDQTLAAAKTAFEAVAS